ncbi:MAG TPA: hypothetical protein VFO14_07395 [Vicinamibacterales bacterium]|nr:hypothetical protein [Vicinamibacterales bacterium]
MDEKPLRHFGLTAGSNVIYLKVSDAAAGRRLTMKTYPARSGSWIRIALLKSL